MLVRRFLFPRKAKLAKLALLVAIGANCASAQNPSSPSDVQIEPVPLQAPAFQAPVLQAPAAQPPVVQPPEVPGTPGPVVPTPQVNQGPTDAAAVPDPGAALPPQLQNIPAQSMTSFASTFGATAGSFSASPTMMGDSFNGGLSAFTGVQIQTFNLVGPGTILRGNPGAADAEIVFEFGGDNVPNDIFTDGNINGTDDDGSNDGFADTFQILEPVPASDAPTSPGLGFVFNGGTAVFIGPNAGATTAQRGQFVDDDNWFINYSYIATIGQDGGRPAPSPGVAVRRVKIAENFSPEVRNRGFINYNFFNDAFAGLGDISRYTFGFEKVLRPGLISIEVRLPTAGTFGSTQVLGQRESRDFEIGNAAVIGKGVLLRDRNFIWSGGLGLTLPLADDTRLQAGGQDLLVVENESVHLLPFTALLLRPSRVTRLQAYLQLDVAAGGDPVRGDLSGGPLPLLGEFRDSTLLHADLAVNRSLYRNRCNKFLREVMLNAEVHYTGTLEDSNVVQGGGLTYTNLKRNFNIVNATLGMHLVTSKHIVVSPGVTVPLRDGLDKQFDYEAIVQMNYLR